MNNRGAGLDWKSFQYFPSIFALYTAFLANLRMHELMIFFFLLCSKYKWMDLFFFFFLLFLRLGINGQMMQHISTEMKISYLKRTWLTACIISLVNWTILERTFYNILNVRLSLCFDLFTVEILSFI